MLHNYIELIYKYYFIPLSNSDCIVPWLIKSREWFQCVTNLCYYSNWTSIMQIELESQTNSVQYHFIMTPADG